MNFCRPTIVISKCLEFEACRYDGALISNKHIRKLKEFIDFKVVCPEVEIGMGVPRDTIRIINNKGQRVLYQDGTGKDFSKKMTQFSKSYLSKLTKVDGFILKSKSPSCGIRSAKVFRGIKGEAVGRGSGFFAEQVLSLFPAHPAEQESRLSDVFYREHFYSAVFTIAEFRSVDSFKKLYEYHAKHKYLFMSYNQLMMTEMGRIAANSQKKDIVAVLGAYFDHLLQIFRRRARYTSNINSLMHVFGYFKNIATPSQKRLFLDSLEMYRNRQKPLSFPSDILLSWINDSDSSYLDRQSFFKPFPRELRVYD